jgi:ubiquinone/menaquinone biosynthesis C-methylase UbiE
MRTGFDFEGLESTFYELSIKLTGHKHYYDLFFSQSNLELVDGCVVLDVGCGGGLLTFGLLNEYLKRGYRGITVKAFDISESMLKLLNDDVMKSCVSRNVRLYQANGENLSDIKEYTSGIRSTFEDNSFDLVMSSGMLEYVCYPEKAIKEMVRVLKPQGQLVLSFVNDNLLGRVISKIWKFRTLSEEYLLGQYEGEGITNFKRFNVKSRNVYMRFLKSIYIGTKG